jgi:hypothetical protein
MLDSQIIQIAEFDSHTLDNSVFNILINEIKERNLDKELLQKNNR